MHLNEYKELLRKRLTDRRYCHSLCVADEAVRLSKMYNCDCEKAYLAGLLHDIMKDAEKSQQLQIIDEFGIILSDLEIHTPKLWHAIAGAAFLERELCLNDNEIVDSVRYHTTARAGMSLLDEILYIADFTSADRDYDNVDIIRGLVDVSLDDALEYALAYSIIDLTKNTLPIHDDTFAAYNEIVMRRRLRG